MSDRKLVCPQCGSENLATVEDISGSALGGAYIDEDGQRTFEHDGWTDVWWDSSTTTGVECRSCYWTSEGESYLEQLAVGKVDDGD